MPSWPRGGAPRRPCAPTTPLSECWARRSSAASSRCGACARLRAGCCRAPTRGRERRGSSPSATGSGPRGMAPRSPSWAATCWSTASRTRSSGWWRPTSSWATSRRSICGYHWAATRCWPAAPSARGGPSAAMPTARRWTRRTPRWRRSASAWPASIPTPIAIGPSGSAPLAKRSPAPTPGSFWRCCSRSSACCWSSRARTS